MLYTVPAQPSRRGSSERFNLLLRATCVTLFLTTVPAALSFGHPLPLPTTDSEATADEPQVIAGPLSMLVRVASQADMRRADDFLKFTQSIPQIQDEEERLRAIEQAIALSKHLTYWPAAQRPLKVAQGWLQLTLCMQYLLRKAGVPKENNTKAIAACETATAAGKKDAALWFEAQLYLGENYRRRSEDGGSDDDIERAIAAFRTALAADSAGQAPSQWALAQDWLGLALQKRKAGDRSANLEQAIKAHETALHYFQPTTVDWAECQQNLASAYESRIEGDGADNIDRAIAHYELSLTALMPNDTSKLWANAQANLGTLYAGRAHGNATENRSRAEAALRSALTVVTRDELVLNHLELISLLGHLLVLDQSWKAAGNVLADARQTFELLYQKNWANEPFLSDLAARSLKVFNDSAYTAAVLGDVEHAIEYFNEGRGRILRVALNLRAETIPEALRHEIDAAHFHVSVELYPDQVPADQATRSAHLAELQSLASGDEAAHTMKGAFVLQDGGFIPGNSAIIAPVITDIGAKVIFILKREGAISTKVVDYPALTNENTQALVRRWTSDYQKLLMIDLLTSVPASSPAFKDSLSKQNQLWQAWLDAIESTNRDLGNVLIAPVLRDLLQFGLPAGARLFWMLPGGMTLLPLASAVYPATNERLNDLYESTLITNLEELEFTKRQAAQTRAPSIIVLANPTGDLEFADIEGMLAASHFPSTAREITHNGMGFMLSAALGKGSGYWHFATHGLYAPENVPRSGIFADRDKNMMSVRTITQNFDRNSSPPRLVILSACETGLSSDFIGNTEFASLPGAFIAKGAAGVIATLWQVDDRATALLMAKFYDLNMDEGQEPGAALRGAQAWLQRATQRDILAYIADAANRGRIDEKSAEKFRLSIRRGRSDNPRFAVNWDVIHRATTEAPASSSADLERPFQHPHYWAGFYYTGY
jgi:CHAT domain-containing protein/tetratricopeptide (TPR) repeat protein